MFPVRTYVRRQNERHTNRSWHHQVWGSLRLAPIIIISLLFVVHRNVSMYLNSQARKIAQLAGPPSTGIYGITPACASIPFLFHHSLQARCDMEVDEGGWMVIQRRVSGGTEDFDRTWKEYEDGFGSLDGEFWYGLRNIYCLTNRDDVELRIDMTRTDGVEMTWVYPTFRVTGSDDKYRLEIGEGEGPGTRDAMAYHNGKPFTTSDHDNDDRSSNCARAIRGGWWYSDCHHSALTAYHGYVYTWYDGYGIWSTLSNSEMKIRPKTCSV